jgi:glycosyltransferase involved in cell wall biosynthesis
VHWVAVTLVSIGIPFFNSEATLALAVRSVFAQTHRDWELVLLDDGSTDGSLALARSIRDPRVRVLSDGRNLGLANRLNELTEEAASAYIVRMDADDAMHPTRVERQLALLEGDPAVDLVGGPSYLMNEVEEVYGLHNGPPLDPDPALFLKARTFPFQHPTITARRAWMLANPYDPLFRKGQEKELFCRTYGSSRFAKLDEPVLFYREGGTMTVRVYRQTRQLDRRMLRMYGPQLLGWPRTLCSALLTYAKEGAYRLAQGLRAIDRFDEAIARRRADALEGSARDAARELLAQLHRTPVPGLD